MAQTDPLPYGDLHSRIEKTYDRLERCLAEIRVAAREAAETEAAYRTGFARARLAARAEGRVSNDHADDKAVAATDEIRLRWKIAESRLLTAREALRTRQAQLDALRTMAASHRAAGG